MDQEGGEDRVTCQVNVSLSKDINGEEIMAEWEREDVESDLSWGKEYRGNGV